MLPPHPSTLDVSDEPGTSPDLPWKLEVLTGLVPNAERYATVGVFDYGLDANATERLALETPDGLSPEPRADVRHGEDVAAVLTRYSKRLRPVRWELHPTGDVDRWTASVRDGIQMAIANGATVVNMSVDQVIGGTTLQDGMSRVDHDTPPSFAAYVDLIRSNPDVLFVLATGEHDAQTSATRELAKAGVENILRVETSTIRTFDPASSRYDILANPWSARRNGTSFSAPKVARALAHAKRLAPHLTVPELKRLSLATAGEGVLDSVPLVETAALLGALHAGDTREEAFDRLDIPPQSKAYLAAALDRFFASA